MWIAESKVSGVGCQVSGQKKNYKEPWSDQAKKSMEHGAWSMEKIAAGRKQRAVTLAHPKKPSN
jgi:hypothetical protein